MDFGPPKCIYSVSMKELHEFLRGGKASLEKLLAAKEELLVAEQKLMTLRSTILGQKEEQEHRKQHLNRWKPNNKTTSTEPRNKPRSSPPTTYKSKNSRIKFRPCSDSSRRPERVNSTINLNRFEFPEKLQTKLTHNSNLRLTLMQSG